MRLKSIATIFGKQRSYLQITRDRFGRFVKIYSKQAFCKFHPKIKAHSNFLCRSCYDKELRKRNKKYRIKIKKYQKQYKIKNYKKLIDYYKQYKKTVSKQKKLNYYYKSKYGISLNDYLLMVKKQQGKCLICGKKPKNKLHIDHNHKTGIIRGLLCFRCNYGIGYFKENLKIFINIYKYLNKSSEVFPTIEDKKEDK